MSVSGVTIIRNGVKLGYPFIQSIRSILPLCSELVVGVGDSEDDTRERILKINDPKIKILDTVWDMSKRSGGEVLSEQTNIALSRCSGDWVFYIQSDEAVNEKDYDLITGALARVQDEPGIEGLVFNYLHFYGSYWTVQTGGNWYRQEVRIVRNGLGIRSHGDAQGFRKDGQKVRAAACGARMYHYGWARPPEVMVEKIRSFHKLWHDDRWIEENCRGTEAAAYFSDLGNLAPYDGDHPAVMADVINRDSLDFITSCRKEYLAHRSLKAAARDLSRRLPFGSHRNFILVKE